VISPAIKNAGTGRRWLKRPVTPLVRGQMLPLQAHRRLNPSHSASAGAKWDRCEGGARKSRAQAPVLPLASQRSLAAGSQCAASPPLGGE